MSGDVVVRVEQLRKRFKIYNNPWDRVREWMTLGAHQRHKDFWALHNISFELKRGESLGIIGPNGAGKSTLLKILTGTLRPTTGNYIVNGQVLSLLELNTGFNPELTGRRNLFVSAELLGFPKSYLEKRLRDIEDFSELGEYLDRPYKFYSTGMRARLGFSLFAFLECDLFIIDEVLAVGDVFFRQKCYARLEELMGQDTAIILVSHSLPVVEQYCRETIVLNQGKVLFHGASSEATKRFLSLHQGSTAANVLPQPTTRNAMVTPVSGNGTNAAWSFGDDTTVSLAADNWTDADGSFWPANDAFLDLSKAVSIGEGAARCTGVALCDEDGVPCQIFEQGQWAYFYYEFELLRDIEVPIGGLTISNDKNILVHGKNTFQYKSKSPFQVKKGAKIRFRHSIALEIAQGEYTFSLGLATINAVDYSNIAYMSHQESIQKFVRLNNIDRAGSFTITLRRQSIPPLLHHGLCNLPGDCEIFLEENRTPSPTPSTDPGQLSTIRD
mgnify:CR=1 FL=1